MYKKRLPWDFDDKTMEMVLASILPLDKHDFDVVTLKNDSLEFRGEKNYHHHKNLFLFFYIT